MKSGIYTTPPLCSHGHPTLALDSARQMLDTNQRIVNPQDMGIGWMERSHHYEYALCGVSRC